MRVLVLLLAIVLLPLRGWLGDAMALAPVQHASSSHAVHASTPAADAHAGHDMHAMHAEAATEDDGHEGHGTCDTCQFCHSIAAMAWPDVPRPVTPPRRMPVSAPVEFASAEAAQGFKPPIS